MKSDFVGIKEADLISSEAKSEISSELCEDFTVRNIESVIDNAYEILKKEEQWSEEPVEHGWINRFFDSVADVSDEDL